jgi:hypothetical protein
VVRSSRLCRGRGDHRKAHELGFEGIEWCGGVYSHEWGFAKLLHWLRHNPEKRSRFVTALEHCDMVAATLCGIKKVSELKRSVCAMGHKWMWNPKWGGLPPEEFLVAVDPLFAGVRAKLGGEYLTSDHLAGHLSPKWAEALGLRAGIPIPVGAFDAHWDAIGSNIREGDVVNVVGTSTCIIAMAREAQLVPGVCGVVPGSVHPATPASRPASRPRRHLRRHCPPRRHHVAALSEGWSLQGRADRPAAAELGQRRPHGAGESRTGRRDAGLEPGSHRAG